MADAWPRDTRRHVDRQEIATAGGAREREVFPDPGVSDTHNGVEILASCAMIVCMLILIDTGEKPNRAMHQMVWHYLIGLASLKELEAFIKT